MNATMNDTAQWLHEYFIQHGSLTLPGVGTFRIQRISAQVDFASKRMLPPSFTIRFDHRHDTPQRDLFAYVSQRSGMADWEAVRSVNNLAFDIKSRLLHGNSVPIDGIGILRPDNGSGFQFDAERINYDFIPKVKADRVIRKDAEHTVRVGELHRSSTEMEEFLQAQKEPLPLSKRLWFRALMLVILALLIYSMRFLYSAETGFSVRQQRIQPADPVPTYSTPKAP
jgi:sporulation protein YlmC with PRC-barrel domain